MDSITTIFNMITKIRYVATIDLKDAKCNVWIIEHFHRYFKFHWKKLYLRKEITLFPSLPSSTNCKKNAN